METASGTSLELFFRSEIAEAKRKSNELSHEAEIYLTLLLTKMAKENCLTVSQPGRENQGLGMELFTVLSESRYLEGRTGRLKAVADASLLVSGLFWQSLSRKLVDVRYFEALGRSAYLNLEGEVFDQLGHNFRSAVEIMTELSFRWKFADPGNLLLLQEVWSKTGNRVIGEKLLYSGVLSPIRTTRIE